MIVCYCGGYCIIKFAVMVDVYHVKIHLRLWYPWIQNYIIVSMIQTVKYILFLYVYLMNDCVIYCLLFFLIYFALFLYENVYMLLYVSGTDVRRAYNDTYTLSYNSMIVFFHTLLIKTWVVWSIKWVDLLMVLHSS